MVTSLTVHITLIFLWNQQKVASVDDNHAHFIFITFEFVFIFSNTSLVNGKWKDFWYPRFGHFCLVYYYYFHITTIPTNLWHSNSTFSSKFLFGFLWRIWIAQVWVEILIQNFSGLFAEISSFPPTNEK